MALSEKARERHAQLIQSYVAALPEKLAEIRTCWQFAISQQWRGDSSAELYRLVHQLAGSGTVFGFPQITETARPTADCLKATGGAQNQEKTDLIAELNRLLERFCIVLADCAADQPSAPTLTASSSFQVREPIQEDPPTRNALYLVEDDEKQAKMLAQHLSAYGYSVRIFTALDAFESAVRTMRPQAVIMDIVFPEGTNAGVNAVKQINAGREDPIPVIFTSIRGDLQVRVEALHAGAVGYFTKPFNPAELIDRLDGIVKPKYFEPYRILIVDDDKALAAFYREILEAAGMEAMVVNDPLRIMGPLINFQPDLLLIDFTMPGCTGLDLAAALRQEDAYARLPMIFISQETDPEKRLACIGVGADDYLAKPVDSDYLVRLVASRVQRGRRLQKMIVRDSLTGLLNHNAFMDRFEEMLALVLREQTKLAFAMLDLDRFKWVNDNYGHLAGDVALKNVARLLMRRLRSTDILGRYGGDEFAIVLVDADPEGARLRIDSLRREMFSISNGVADSSFSVTFSAGVTGYDCKAGSDSPPPDVNRIIRRADQALYRAKKDGRNRVQADHWP